MRFAFAVAADEARSRGFRSFVWFWCRSLGHIALYAVVERLPEASSRNWRSGLVADLIYGARRLRRSPGFTVAAVLTLALGIGATTAVFALVRSVVLSPLPYPTADRLVAMQHTAEGAGLPLMGMSLGTYSHYREYNQTFEEVTVYRQMSFALLGDEGTQRVPGAKVTRGFFEIFLDGAPLLGRAFSDADQQLGAPRVALISHELWQTRYGSEAGVVGRSISVDGSPVEVVGVLPAAFDVPSNETHLWLPEQLDPQRVILGGFGRQGVGRLRSGIGPEQAQADLQRLIPALADRFNPVAFDLLVTGGRLTPRVRPLKDTVVGDIEQTLWILLGTVVFVLGIACANVANLFLVRAESQRREVAVRAALGAGRAQIVRHHLAESLSLGLLGGVAGVLLAMLAVRWVVAWGPSAVPRLHEVGLGAPALVVAVVASLTASVAFGLIPLLTNAGQTTAGVMSDSARGNTTGRERHRIRNSLVVVQISLALVLSVGAGLMVRTFWHLRALRPGLEASSSLVFQAGLPAALYPEPDKAFRFQQQILDQLRTLPGVVEVGATFCLPLDPCDGRTPIYVEGVPIEPGETPPSVDVRGVTSGFFRALGIPVVDGRGLESTDAGRTPAAALVSRNLADRLWPGESAIGKRIYPDYPEEDPYTVVGVVGNVLAYGPTEEAPEILYLSFLGPYAYTAPPNILTFVVRTAVPPLSVAPAVRAAVRGLDPNVPLSGLRTMQDVLDVANAPTAFAMILLVLAGGVALVLGTVGVYGVLSYIVSQRGSEIGVRMALGAEAGDVSRMVLMQGARVVAVGTVVGFAGAAVLTRLMSAVLYGVSSFDPPTYAAVGLGLGLVAMLASYIPARRAAAVDPTNALRSQ